MRQLLDGKVHHLPKAGIFILEELRDAEEQGRRFVGGESFTGVQEQGDFREQDSTSSGLYGRRIEQSCCDLLAGLAKGQEVHRPSWKTDVLSTLMMAMSASSSFLL
jgi:hypothetical protein